MVWLKRMMALAVAILGISGALGAGEGNDVDAMDAESLWKRAEFLEEHSSWSMESNNSVYVQRVNEDGSVDDFYHSKYPDGRTVLYRMRLKGIPYQIEDKYVIQENFPPSSRIFEIDSKRTAQYKRLPDTEIDGEKCYVLEKTLTPSKADFELYEKSYIEKERASAKKNYEDSIMRSIKMVSYANRFVRVAVDYTADGRMVSKMNYKNVTLNPATDPALWVLPNLPIVVARSLEEQVKLSDAGSNLAQEVAAPKLVSKRRAISWTLLGMIAVSIVLLAGVVLIIFRKIHR